VLNYWVVNFAQSESFRNDRSRTHAVGRQAGRGEEV
ncbi:unnamed protein product, partial [marine sediment metagenome]